MRISDGSSDGFSADRCSALVSCSAHRRNVNSSCSMQLHLLSYCRRCPFVNGPIYCGVAPMFWLPNGASPPAPPISAWRPPNCFPSRSEEHTSDLPSIIIHSSAVFCFQTKHTQQN